MIPNPYTRPTGLLGEIANFLYLAAPRPVPEIALAGAIGFMAGIPSSATGIQTAMNSAGIGSLDLTLRGVLVVPLSALSAFELGRISPRLPLR